MSFVVSRSVRSAADQKRDGSKVDHKGFRCGFGLPTHEIRVCVTRVCSIRRSTSEGFLPKRIQKDHVSVPPVYRQIRSVEITHPRKYEFTLVLVGKCGVVLKSLFLSSHVIPAKVSKSYSCDGNEITVNEMFYIERNIFIRV
jgi:hypothetical protein